VGRLLVWIIAAAFRPKALLMSAYVTYFNYWRPHRSLGQRAPCESAVLQFRPREANCKITAEPVLGELHHIYKRAA
jgi:hypothetical protein